MSPPDLAAGAPVYKMNSEIVMTKFKNILVPVDFSEHSLNAVRLAVEIARLFGSQLTLIHIGVVPHVYSTELGLGGTAGPLFSEMSQAAAAEQYHRLEKVAREEIPDSLKAETLVREGFPPEEILAQVEAGGHDLVIMGTHGRTGLGRVLLGSVTERVVREIKVPIMVTR